MSATAFARWAFPLGLAIEARGNTWTTYGHHEPTCCWSYQPPAGVEVVTDEPDDWSGWRAPAIAEPMAPGQLELALSTVRAA